LMWATADVDKVRLLLDRGADINASAKDKTTALVAATQRGAADVVRLLLERHADPLASGDGGAALFQAAFVATNGEVRRVLADAGLKPSNVGQIAPALGRLDAVDHDVIARFLEVGGDPNLKIPMITVQMPLLGYAASTVGPETVRLLLDRGAEPNVTSTRGATPLMMAAAAANPQSSTVQMLLDAGAKLDTRDDEGRSALDWALKQGETDVVRLLRKAGAPSPLPEHSAGAAMAHPRPAAEAVRLAVGTMDGISPAFYQRTHCISCHNQSLPAIARQAASVRGVAIDPAVAHHPDQATFEVWTPRRNAQFVGRCGGNGYLPSVAYALAAMAAEQTPPNTVTDSVVACTAGRQSPDGAFRVNDVRPPLSGSAIVYTALTIRGLDAYAPPGLRPDVQRRIDLARGFLLHATPQDTQDQAFKLLGLVWARASASEIAAEAARLLALQRPEGGWSQTMLMKPDAYATGQALYALRLAGTSPADAPYRTGAQFLLRTQQEDGSWFVPSRGFGFQPFAEYGFPHGRSQFLSAAATSWAVIALSETL
jgi:ankyrin repeat protein